MGCVWNDTLRINWGQHFKVDLNTVFLIWLGKEVYIWWPLDKRIDQTLYWLMGWLCVLLWITNNCCLRSPPSSRVLWSPHTPVVPLWHSLCYLIFRSVHSRGFGSLKTTHCSALFICAYVFCVRVFAASLSWAPLFNNAGVSPASWPTLTTCEPGLNKHSSPVNKPQLILNRALIVLMCLGYSLRSTK